MILILNKITQKAASKSETISMLKSEPAKVNNWAGGLVRQVVHVFFGILLAVSAHAATYYVDSSVSSSGNGQSWATAWQNLSNITGLAAGDTVYISGGPSGSSQTYAVSSWAPANGSASGVITYQIGQDSAHNGNAIFSGSGNFFGGAPNYVVFSGQVANDTAQHFTLTNYSGIVGGTTYYTATNFRFAYVSATLNVTDEGLWFYGGSGLEIDHNYLNAVSGSGGNGGNDELIQFSVAAGGTWDAGALVHNNTAILPHLAGTQKGFDFIICNGTGISVYSNLVMGAAGTYNGTQHGDGVQALGGTTYLKVYANIFSNIPNSAVFLDCWGDNITYAYIYNNIIYLPGSSGNMAYGMVGGPDSGGPTTGTLNNCVVANNVLDGAGADWAMEWAGPGSGVNFTPGLFVLCNNVFLNGATPSYSFNSGGQQVVADNPTGVSSSDFVNASAGNFHLTSTATDLIGKGTNLSSFFTIDADGNSRHGLPAAWDIGAYAYGTNSGANGSGSSNASLTFAAQSGLITAPFVLGTNGTTIYVYQPILTVGINSNGIAIYSFTITNAGNYEVQALVNAPNDAANSLYVNVDGVPQDPGMTWDVLITSGFEERLISWRGNGTDTSNQYVPWLLSLTKGLHQLEFYGREANTELAGFSILPAPPTPAPPLIITQ
jgi:hypothetical protein